MSTLIERATEVMTEAEDWRERLPIHEDVADVASEHAIRDLLVLIERLTQIVRELASTR